MDYQINERWIRISSKLPVPFNIEEGDDVVINVMMGTESKQFILNAAKEEFPFNQDGTRDKVSVLKSLSE